MYLSEEEITTSEKWINELQEEYNGASAIYTKYENEKQLIEQKEKVELNRQHMMKLREEECQRIVQQTVIKKKSVEAIFSCFVAKYSYKILADIRKNRLEVKVCSCFVSSHGNMQWQFLLFNLYTLYQ